MPVSKEEFLKRMADGRAKAKAAREAAAAVPAPALAPAAVPELVKKVKTVKTEKEAAPTTMPLAVGSPVTKTTKIVRKVVAAV